MSDQPSKQSRGGRARAAALSPERRREIATFASHARKAQPKPVDDLALSRVRAAQAALRFALSQFTATHCDKAADKVRKAISSADCAIRNMQGHRDRALSNEETK